jgi:hypothetical protein
MPRAMRRFEEGRFYHVYNRVGGGLLPFLDEGLKRNQALTYDLICEHRADTRPSPALESACGLSKGHKCLPGTVIQVLENPAA